MSVSIKLFALLLLSAVLFQGCGEDDVLGVANAASTICSNVNGAEAIHWDLEHGIPRTDLSGGIPPNVDVIGGT